MKSRDGRDFDDYFPFAVAALAPSAGWRCDQKNWAASYVSSTHNSFLRIRVSDDFTSSLPRGFACGRMHVGDAMCRTHSQRCCVIFITPMHALLCSSHACVRACVHTCRGSRYYRHIAYEQLASEVRVVEVTRFADTMQPDEQMRNILRGLISLETLLVHRVNEMNTYVAPSVV